MSNLNIVPRVLKNQYVLNGLEKISKHPTSFSAGLSLGMAGIVRPLAIAATPNTEKENKQYAITNSISSAIVKFLMVEMIALPVELAIKKIDNNPTKYLKTPNFKGYKFITQFYKLLPGLFTAIPKSMLTVALIPVLMDKIFKIKPDEPLLESKTDNISSKGNISSQNFSGGNLAKIIAKTLNNKKIQEFAAKHEEKAQDIAKHTTATTDILLVGTSAYKIQTNEKIKENRKKALILNNVISTGITLAFGYGIDKIIRSKTKDFIEKFKKLNADKPPEKMVKYIEGINILRPAIIFAFIYYGILPFLSTYISDKLAKEKNLVK